MDVDARPRIVWQPARNNISLWGRLSRPFRFKEEEAAVGARLSLQMAGVPRVESAKTPKEDAVGLLQLAAEVEHALLVQYLYARLSLQGPEKNTLKSIAIQEMGHLICVQNLLLALEGVGTEGLCSKIHLARDPIRRKSDMNPLLFALESVSSKVLAKYISAERPVVIPDAALRARVEALGQEAIEDGVVPHPVSALYSKLLWLFQPTDDYPTSLGLKPDMGLTAGWHLAPDDFAPTADVNDHASTLGDWGGYPTLIVEVVTDATSACLVIEKIIAQGEGVLAAAGSHFERFLGVLDVLEAGKLKVRPLPRTPYVDTAGVPPEDPHATRIEAPYTALWCNYFNLHYEQLLVDIAWLLALKRGDPRRDAWSKLLVRGMSSVLQAVAEHICDLPLAHGGNLNAGPSYQCQSDDVPRTMAGFTQRYAALNASLAACEAAIVASADYQICTAGVCNVNDVEGEIVLDTARGLAEERAPLLP